MKKIVRCTNCRAALAWSLALALLVGVAIGASAQQPAETEAVTQLVAGMVAFDRAYIPALALSNQNKPELSRKALTILREQWSSFEGQFSDFSGEADWQHGFQQTAAVLAHSQDLLKSGELAGAHGALEEVREIFRALRERRSIPYYIDYLNGYHASMEAVIGVLSGRTAATLGNEQVRQVSALLPEARRKWEATLAAPFDARLYGLSSVKAAELRKAEEGVLRGIEQVEQALRSGDRDALYRAVVDLKPAFTRTYLMFGDFERVNQ